MKSATTPGAFAELTRQPAEWYVTSIVRRSSVCMGNIEIRIFRSVIYIANIRTSKTSVARRGLRLARSRLDPEGSRGCMYRKDACDPRFLESCVMTGENEGLREELLRRSSRVCGPSWETEGQQEYAEDQLKSKSCISHAQSRATFEV